MPEDPDHKRNRVVNRDVGTWWPAGDASASFEELPRILLSSARWHSLVALAQFRSAKHDELLQAAISVGTASELIVKSVLATIGMPLLVAERTDPDSLLLVSNQGHRTSLGAGRFKSVSASSAHEMVKKLLNITVIRNAKELETQNVRNAAAHMALVETKDLKAALVQHCRLVAALLPHLGSLLKSDLEPSVAFWGAANVSQVEVLLDEAASEISTSVVFKIAEARVRFKTIEALPADPRTVVMALLSDRRNATGDYEEQLECPACHNEGWMQYTIERGPVESESDGHDVSVWVSRTAYATDFECPFCDLELDEDEVRDPHCSFPIELELEPDFEPEEVYDWEPDEDWLRDR